MVNSISKAELQKYEHFLTVGELKEFLYKHNIPNDSKVLIQRIEDVYFEKHGWDVYLKEGEHSYKDDNGNIVPESMEQYHPAWSCARYNDDPDILFIDLHY